MGETKIFDKIQELIVCLMSDTGKYPNRIIIGIDKYNKLISEAKEMGYDVPEYPVKIAKVWDIPVIVIKEKPDIVEVGFMTEVKMEV